MDQRTDQFFDAVPLFDEFGGVAEAANYRPLPDGWALASADIVNSTDAVDSGRYKSVNMAGASVISGLLNALGRRDLPFVFGGDGATIAFPLSDVDGARAALAAIQTWVSEELGLRLRAAIVPVADIRAEGLDVRVARYKASDQVSYAMFAGGGASWGEKEMKKGRFAVAPAPPGTRPDLAGLSCRWNPVDSRNGEIASIIAMPGRAGDTAKFQELVADIVAIAGEQARGGHPVPLNGPTYGWPPLGLDTEARAAAPKGKRLMQKAGILAQVALAWGLDRFNITLGAFDPKVYKSDVSQNSDFRKFDDGLKMTIDVAPEILKRIEERLSEAEKAGICDFGIHNQNSALMTCMVATPLQRDHVHFIDGASGGYAVAASKLKAKLAA